MNISPFLSRSSKLLLPVGVAVVAGLGVPSWAVAAPAPVEAAAKHPNDGKGANGDEDEKPKCKHDTIDEVDLEKELDNGKFKFGTGHFMFEAEPTVEAGFAHLGYQQCQCNLADTEYKVHTVNLGNGKFGLKYEIANPYDVSIEVKPFTEPTGVSYFGKLTVGIIPTTSLEFVNVNGSLYRNHCTGEDRLGLKASAEAGIEVEAGAKVSGGLTYDDNKILQVEGNASIVKLTAKVHGTLDFHYKNTPAQAWTFHGSEICVDPITIGFLKYKSSIIGGDSKEEVIKKALDPTLSITKEECWNAE